VLEPPPRARCILPLDAEQSAIHMLEYGGGYKVEIEYVVLVLRPSAP
jgi:hypothetical protein